MGASQAEQAAQAVQAARAVQAAQAEQTLQAVQAIQTAHEVQAGYRRAITNRERQRYSDEYHFPFFLKLTHEALALARHQLCRNQSRNIIFYYNISYYMIL